MSIYYISILYLYLYVSIYILLSVLIECFETPQEAEAQVLAVALQLPELRAGVLIFAKELRQVLLLNL